MHSFLWTMGRLEPRLRRTVIMLMDSVMVLTAIPLSLMLSNSTPSFDPTSAEGLVIWLSIGLVSHLLFRFSGLYRMMWRFASTPDFFNILKNCVFLTLGLYAAALVVRAYTPVTGLNERQFLVFFFMTFVFISTPRLVYRYLREGTVWSGGHSGATKKMHKRALFFGSLAEADVIISYSRASITDAIRVVGIATNDAATVGSKIQGVPIVSDSAGARQVFDEYTKDTESLDLLIFGEGAEKAFPEFAELVRIARRGGVAVEQFSGLSQLRKSGKLVLERVEMETILRRTTVTVDSARLFGFLAGKRVLVTGGAGSIGRTLVRRALDLDAAAVLVADLSELNIFQLQSALSEWKDRSRVTLRIIDICDKRQFASIVERFRPDIIFHAAALKHVPLLEENWESAIKTNVFGTLNCVEVASECNVPHFVLISSDKAADPTSVLGLTKRMAEQIVNARHAPGGTGRAGNPGFIGVRFGNVFGSDGSVATIFQKQIDDGGPVTITDPMMTRYLMTVGEAVDLVMTAAAVSAETGDGELGSYMLDMGEPVSILAVAETMIRLAGLKPYDDISIVITGTRPGEKLHETLTSPDEQVINIGVPSIFGLRIGTRRWSVLNATLRALRQAVEARDRAGAIRIMMQLPETVEDAEEVEAPAVQPEQRMEPVREATRFGGRRVNPVPALIGNSARMAGEGAPGGGDGSWNGLEAWPSAVDGGKAHPATLQVVKGGARDQGEPLEATRDGGAVAGRLASGRAARSGN